MKLQQIRNELESEAVITGKTICDIVGITILNNTNKTESLMESLSTATTLLILLTVPAQPHKGHLQWQLAVMRL